MVSQTFILGKETSLTKVNTLPAKALLAKVCLKFGKCCYRIIWTCSLVLRRFSKPTIVGVRVHYPVELCLSSSSVIMPLSFVEGDGTLTMKQNSVICRGCVVLLVGNSKITIGEGSCVGDYSSLLSWGCGNIVIGSNVQIASYCHVVSKRTSINNDGSLTAEGVETSIGDGTWIGSNVTIIDGVTIGRNVVVGAKSLVNCSVPDNSIVYGVPAKVVAMRKCINLQ